MTYATQARLPSSKKYTLAWLEPSERLVLWDNVSGSIYNRTVPHFVTNVSENGTDLIEASSTALSSGEWYFYNKTLYVRTSDDTTPQAKFMSAFYRLFFADHPISLEHDLDAGFEVPYDGSLKPFSPIKVGLDSEQMGQAIESSGRISFNLTDFWVDNFDTLIWENKPVKVFSSIKGSDEVRTIFDGEITSKSYSPTSISFQIKDPLHKLRQFVASDLYSLDDGNISSDIIGTPKRVIYGKLDGLRMQSLDQVLSGYDLTGTISVSADLTALSGSGTEFLKELSPDDEITFENATGTEFSYRIESIESDTVAAISGEASETVDGATATNKPEINYRFKNRSFLIAGHKLREPTTTISVNASQLNRITLTDNTDFLVGDSILVGSETAIIKRVSGGVTVLTQNLDALATAGTVVKKQPVTAVYFDSNKYVLNRDFTASNTASGCSITLGNDAEFNVVNQQKLKGSITFTGSSREVSGVGSLFETDIKPRDWIASTDATHTTFYEVLSVTDNENLLLRVAYAGGNTSGAARKKNVNYIGDDSIVTCDCIGKENAAGEWVKTPSDAVKDLLALGGITNIDTASFTASDTDAPFIMSLKLPLEKTAGMPSIKTAISYVNQSCFGSLVNRSDYKLAFTILSPDRPLISDDRITDADILSFSVTTNSDTVRKVIGRYKHQDNERYSGEESSSLYSYTNDFVDYLVGTTEEEEIPIYLYSEDDAQTMVQRHAFIKALSQQVIQITGGGLGLSSRELNDKVYLDLTKLYKRFGGSDYAKIVIVNELSKSGKDYNITVNDLGNYFSRVAAIAADDVDDFATSSINERILSGYIVDDDTELCGSTETEANTNLLG